MTLTRCDMDQNEPAGLFAPERPKLRAVAYRTVGPMSNGDDAAQEAWCSHFAR